MNRFRYLLWLVSLLSSLYPIRAAVVITDFSIVNPLNFAYGGSTWSTPVNQFQSFSNGMVTGQEVVSLGGGNPTVSGGAGRVGLSLNLSGNTGLELTARLLSGNQATMFQVLIFDADGTILRLSFPTINFNTSTFVSTFVTLASGTITTPGSVAGFNLANVTVYEVQGNFFDASGAAAARVQFDQLVATTPEPSTGLLCVLGLGFLFYRARAPICSKIHSFF
jgi:hypothetical protein